MSLLSDYNARIIHVLLSGEKLPSIKDLVLEELKRTSPQKREDLVRAVESKIKEILQAKHGDDSISHAVSEALSQLKKEGNASNLSHGIWEIQ